MLLLLLVLLTPDGAHARVGVQAVELVWRWLIKRRHGGVSARTLVLS